VIVPGVGGIGRVVQRHVVVEFAAADAAAGAMAGSPASASLR
jgi:hypothetical protein